MNRILRYRNNDLFLKEYNTIEEGVLDKTEFVDIDLTKVYGITEYLLPIYLKSTHMHELYKCYKLYIKSLSHKDSRGFVKEERYFLTDESIFNISNGNWIKSDTKKKTYDGLQEYNLSIWYDKNKLIYISNEGIQLEDNVFISYNYSD